MLSAPLPTRTLTFCGAVGSSIVRSCGVTAREGLKARIVQQVSRYIVQRVDQVIALLGNILFGRVGVSLLPIVVLDQQRIIVLALVSVVPVAVPASPVVVIGMEHHVPIYRDHRRP